METKNPDEIREEVLQECEHDVIAEIATGAVTSYMITSLMEGVDESEISTVMEADQIPDSTTISAVALAVKTLNKFVHEDEVRGGLIDGHIVITSDVHETNDQLNIPIGDIEDNLLDSYQCEVLWNKIQDELGENA